MRGEMRPYCNTTGTSFAEPEPVERHLFARARAEVFSPGSGAEYVNSYKMIQKQENFLKSGNFS
jgi:hypothetical protein